MSRPRNTVPKLCHDRSRNSAFCKVRGRFVRLGEWGSAEAQAAYGQLLADLAQGRDIERAGKPAKSRPALTVNELVLAFMLHAQEHYKHPKTGKPTAELDCYKSAVRPLVSLFGATDLTEFGPLKLAQVRDAYVAAGWSRGFCNKSVNRVRHIIKWGVSKEMCPVAILDTLRALPPLLAGKCAARETKRRQAVPAEHIELVREHLTPLCRDIFDLIRLTGCRPAELLGLTGNMIDRSGPVWVATVVDHKNAWRGLERKLHFGPKAQLILRRHLTANGTAALFKLNRSSLTDNIRAICQREGIPHFTAYALRHTLATDVRDLMGLEHAQAALGHQHPTMTAHYAGKQNRLATAAAKDEAGGRIPSRG